jgi:hypothetical protein
VAALLPSPPPHPATKVACPPISPHSRNVRLEVLFIEYLLAIEIDRLNDADDWLIDAVVPNAMTVHQFERMNPRITMANLSAVFVCVDIDRHAR